MSVMPAAALEKAHEALRAAHVLLKEDSADGCISRAYYAAFYVASGALWLVDEQPKTHAGVGNRFWVRFVQTGQFPEELGQKLHTAFDARQRADYDFISRHDTAAAADLLRDVEAFVEAAEELIQRLSA